MSETTCPTCGGRGTLWVPDSRGPTFEQRHPDLAPRYGSNVRKRRRVLEAHLRTDHDVAPVIGEYRLLQDQHEAFHAPDEELMAEGYKEMVVLGAYEGAPDSTHAKEER
jgi:hypothetical protein